MLAIKQLPGNVNLIQY